MTKLNVRCAFMERWCDETCKAYLRYTGDCQRIESVKKIADNLDRLEIIVNPVG